MKLSELFQKINESKMSDLHLDFQEAVMKKFHCTDEEAEKIVDHILNGYKLKAKTSKVISDFYTKDGEECLSSSVCDDKLKKDFSKFIKKNVSESKMSDLHLDFQEAVMKKFHCTDEECEDLVDALLKNNLSKAKMGTIEMVQDYYAARGDENLNIHKTHASLKQDFSDFLSPKGSK